MVEILKIDLFFKYKVELGNDAADDYSKGIDHHVFEEFAIFFTEGACKEVNLESTTSNQNS